MKLEEVWKMGGVFDKFQKEENEKMIKLGMRVMKMYMSGKSIEEIAERTNLSEQLIREVVCDSD